MEQPCSSQPWYSPPIPPESSFNESPVCAGVIPSQVEHFAWHLRDPSTGSLHTHCGLVSLCLPLLLLHFFFVIWAYFEGSMLIKSSHFYLFTYLFLQMYTICAAKKLAFYYIVIECILSIFPVGRPSGVICIKNEHVPEVAFSPSCITISMFSWLVLEKLIVHLSCQKECWSYFCCWLKKMHQILP